MMLRILFGSLLVPVVAYILFLFLCSLFVNPRKEYQNYSLFYRSLLPGYCEKRTCGYSEGDKNGRNRSFCQERP